MLVVHNTAGAGDKFCSMHLCGLSIRAFYQHVRASVAVRDGCMHVATANIAYAPCSKAMHGSAFVPIIPYQICVSAG